MDASVRTGDERMNDVAGALLGWYDRHARALPWRMAPGTPVPVNDRNFAYRVWLSEVMLQQTTVAAVIPYFSRFTQRWPGVLDLAAAEDSEILAAWAGLGYYARARNLIACARAVAARGGVFPDSEDELRGLPGLGAYTAAAVAAIAFGRRAVVVDANVERVVARLFAIGDPLPGARGAIRAAADEITPEVRAGDFAQAMMDLGSAVCTAKAPACLACPLAGMCVSRAGGDPAAYPVKAAKKAKAQRRGRAFWIVCGDAVWLVRRPDKGMLGGMRALPDDGWSARADGDGVVPGAWKSAGSVRHVFTHAELALEVAMVEPGFAPQGAGEWWPLARLDEAGLPTLYARAADVALRGSGEG
ncbi:MAG: A/G-specific adenine glycosylase [Sphingomonadales bacterium]|nr:A/G-specific adenine glycosylase [Sphingomonadales bacterium]